MLIHVILPAVACESTILHVKTREGQPAESCIFQVFSHDFSGVLRKRVRSIFTCVFQVFSHDFSGVLSRGIFRVCTALKDLVRVILFVVDIDATYHER